MSRFLPSVAPDIRAGQAEDLKAISAVLPYLWPRDDMGLRIRLVLAAAILATTALMNALVPMVLAKAVDELSPVEASAVIVAPVGLLLGYGIVFWLSRSLNELRWILFGPVEQRVRRRLGLAIFQHLHTLSLRYHLSKRTGTISRIHENGLRAVADLLFNVLFTIAPLVAEIAVICIVLLIRFEPHFAAITFLTLAMYLTALFVGSEWLRRYQRPAVIRAAEAHGKAIDSLLNYETVKYFGNETYISDRYDDELKEVERLTVRSLIIRSLIGVGQMSVLGLGIATLILLAGFEVADGTITVGSFVMVNLYLIQVARPLERLGNIYRSIKQALIDLEQMIQIFDEAPEVIDASDAKTLPEGPGAVVFTGVSFAYDPRRQILHDISFEIPAGKKVALVGPSGGGKTTVGRLLFRFYDPTAGAVRVDGEDAIGVTQSSFRAAIGVVPQDTILFNDTIRENIEFGRPGASWDDVIRAARLAQIHDFIESLPDGYDTVVGERGLKLSGGEKQRVAIARAVLKRPRIYLFDEATSALDSHTEQAIQSSLTEVSRGTTTLVIAHRLSTIVDADQILFVDAGRIVERGTHDELLVRDGAYASLWQRQQRHIDDEGNGIQREPMADTADPERPRLDDLNDSLED